MTAEERQYVARCMAIVERGTKPIVPEVRPLVREYYRMPQGGAGGSLHVVLDDNNYDSVQFCLEYAQQAKDHCGEALARVLLLCSRTQIGKLASGNYE